MIKIIFSFGPGPPARQDGRPYKRHRSGEITFPCPTRNVSRTAKSNFPYPVRPTGCATGSVRGVQFAEQKSFSETLTVHIYILYTDRMRCFSFPPPSRRNASRVYETLYPLSTPVRLRVPSWISHQIMKTNPFRNGHVSYSYATKRASSCVLFSDKTYKFSTRYTTQFRVQTTENSNSFATPNKKLWGI